MKYNRHAVWTHKRGTTEISHKDSSGAKIENPDIASKNYGDENYSIPCGVYCAKN